jgi:hypothetical protein
MATNDGKATKTKNMDTINAIEQALSRYLRVLSV